MSSVNAAKPKHRVSELDEHSSRFILPFLENFTSSPEITHAAVTRGQDPVIQPRQTTAHTNVVHGANTLGDPVEAWRAQKTQAEARLRPLVNLIGNTWPVDCTHEQQQTLWDLVYKNTQILLKTHPDINDPCLPTQEECLANGGGYDMKTLLPLFDRSGGTDLSDPSHSHSMPVRSHYSSSAALSSDIEQFDQQFRTSPYLPGSASTQSAGYRLSSDSGASQSDPQSASGLGFQQASDGYASTSVPTIRIESTANPFLQPTPGSSGFVQNDLPLQTQEQERIISHQTHTPHVAFPDMYGLTMIASMTGGLSGQGGYRSQPCQRGSTAANTRFLRFPQKDMSPKRGLSQPPLQPQPKRWGESTSSKTSSTRPLEIPSTSSTAPKNPALLSPSPTVTSKPKSRLNVKGVFTRFTKGLECSRAIPNKLKNKESVAEPKPELQPALEPRETPDVKGGSKKIFKCTACDKSFKSKHSLSRHNASKHENYRFKCDNCGFGFTQKCSLDRHLSSPCEKKKQAGS